MFETVKTKHYYVSMEIQAGTLLQTSNKTSQEDHLLRKMMWKFGNFISSFIETIREEINVSITSTTSSIKFRI